MALPWQCHGIAILGLPDYRAQLSCVTFCVHYCFLMEFRSIPWILPFLVLEISSYRFS